VVRHQFLLKERWIFLVHLIVGSAVLITSCGFVTGSDCATSAVRFQEVVLEASALSNFIGSFKL
jgi:hypothetical protein